MVLIEQAQAQRPTCSSDRISSVFVAGDGIAALTAAGWLIAGDNPTTAVSTSPCLSSYLVCPGARRLRRHDDGGLWSRCQLGRLCEGSHKSLEAPARWFRRLGSEPATTRPAAEISATAAPGWEPTRCFALADRGNVEHSGELAITAATTPGETRPTRATRPRRPAAPCRGGQYRWANNGSDFCHWHERPAPRQSLE